MCAECHPNSDFAGSTCNRVGFHAINTDHCQQERDHAESTEERRAQFHDPKSDGVSDKIDIRRDVENGQVGIDVAQALTHGRDHSGNGTSILSVESNMKKDVAVVAVREWHK